MIHSESHVHVDSRMKMRLTLDKFTKIKIKYLTFNELFLFLIRKIVNTTISNNIFISIINENICVLMLMLADNDKTNIEQKMRTRWKENENVCRKTWQNVRIQS